MLTKALVVQVSARVTRGIQYLNTRQYGATDRINIGTVDVNDDDGCPGAQALGMTYQQMTRIYGLSHGEAVRLGLAIPAFSGNFHESGRSVREQYRDAINKEWERALRIRAEKSIISENVVQFQRAA